MSSMNIKGNKSRPNVVAGMRLIENWLFVIHFSIFQLTTVRDSHLFNGQYDRFSIPLFSYKFNLFSLLTCFTLVRHSRYESFYNMFVEDY